ncbi:MAG: RsmB/NOP family class I SAM-dependent RNA methyltransferase [Acidilobaceae archaeon]
MGACGTPLEYDVGLLEVLDSASGPLCRLLESLTRPAPRLYVRVNTLKTSPERYLELLRSLGLDFRRDEEIEEALWTPVEGPQGITVYDKAVVADKNASESVLMGSDLYAPGVLEARGVREGDSVTIYSPNGVPVGSGVAVTSWEEAARRKRGLFVRVTEPVYRAPRVSELPGYGELSYGQSITSMYVARILNPKPGEVIVDFNAAPGGKIGHVAQLAGPRATIVGVDRPSKVEKLENTLRKLGASWVKVIGGDSRRASELLGDLSGRVDAVLVDPPCTDIGVIPKVYDRRTLRESVSAARYQLQFVREAYRVLRKGGRLVYSTCTLTDVENEAVVEYALSLGFELEEPDFRPRARGRDTGYGYRFSPHLDGTPGFFVSMLLVKKR